MATVLVIDDDLDLLTTTSRLLTRAGHGVRMAKDLAEVPPQMADGLVDVVVTDLVLPDGAGATVLRAIRALSPSVPVVVLTGQPSFDSAMAAIETSAVKYLLKPVEPAELLAAVEEAGSRGQPDQALSARLTAALGEVWFALQPIVDVESHVSVAWEALLRGRAPGLSRPDDIVSAASRVGRMIEVGRSTREVLAVSAAELPKGADLYVNLHPAELVDPKLFADDEPMLPFADRVVLEITERASLAEMSDVHARIEALRERGYRIAIDDLGAGYSGLTALVQLRPDVVKLDMSLTRGLDTSPTQQKVIGSIARLCDDLGIRIIAEGVETAAERDCLTSMSVHWMQGYLFARPAAGYPVPAPW
jgi:EAL domain-containing protein (putative c-di-GMP-specific phosphodiesterase class I)